MNQSMRSAVPLALAALMLSGCGDEDATFAKVYEITSMAQTIGGPAESARPGDLMLENDRIRAVIHGRHNYRSTFPIANGSLVDLDLQRPHHRYGVGKGKDAFYELGPMVNLKVNASVNLGTAEGRAAAHGVCTEAGGKPSVGESPCPRDADDRPIEGCVRVTASGRGEDIIGVLGLLDLAIQREFESDDLRIYTDYDLCPGEAFVRVTTTAGLDDPKAPVKRTLSMDDLRQQTGLVDVLLGEHTGVDCAKDTCPSGQSCDDLLLPLAAGGIDMEMKRCREPDDKLAGVIAGDFIFFSGKANIFIAGAGFDHDSYIRTLFDTGGDIFSNPLSMPVVAGVGDDVSYAYFNAGGELMIPVFSEAFTASMTNRFACPSKDPDCLAGTKVRFRRYVSVGKGDVASALAAFYAIREVPTAVITGNVIAPRSSRPLSDVDVFVFKVPATWSKLDAAAIRERTYAQLVDATRTGQNPDGEMGIVSHFKSDVGIDELRDGSFGGPVPVGGQASFSCVTSGSSCRYILVARGHGRATSALHPVTVTRGSTTRVTVVAGHRGRLEYDVRDNAGRLLPAKLTVGHCFAECARDQDCSGSTPRCDTATRLCVPEAGYRSAGDCRPDQVWNGETCACLTGGARPLSLGGHRFSDGTVATHFTSSGRGTLELEPGTYQLIFSRGPEYEISRRFVTLRPGMVARAAAVLPRVVDTRGWISADFHVHGPNSVDSGLGYHDRVTSYAAEGVELLTATDHDHLTNYWPMIFELGLQRWLATQTGVEVSPLDYGHFIGFPLRFDINQELNGAFHWRQNDPVKDENLQDWRNLTPFQIYGKLREIGSLGVERTVVFVAHFYDHFTFFSVDPFTMEQPPGLNLTALFNPVLQTFQGGFDGLEGFNGKGFDLVRRPTYKEMRDYNVKLDAAIKQAARSKMTARRRQQLFGAISADAQREMLRRTPQEQSLALSYGNASFECRCALDAECGAGFICDGDTGACASACTGDSQCDATLVAAGREACKPKSSADPTRKVCTRLGGSCTRDADCTSFKGERCVFGKCELPCTADGDCKADRKRPVCDQQRKVCAGPVPATGLDPCVQLRGTVDDWFQLLNRGLRPTFLGNSDSHGTYSIEAGCPRNYIRSSGDLPPQIDIGQVADRVKAGNSFTSYGPFVELTINGAGLGSTVEVESGKQVALGLKIQSPLWFDVDRVEVYRNGRLVKVIEGSTSCGATSQPCIKVPNDRVVNFEGTLTDRPDRDSWYVVLAMGLDGKSMAPVYSSTPVGRLGMFELIQRLVPLLPPLRAFKTPLPASMARVRPLALTNPIFVDVGGDGFKAPLPPPSWATKSVGSSSSGLTQTPGHGSHDHGKGLGRMKLDARRLLQLTREGTVTADALRRAFEQLRFVHLSP